MRILCLLPLALWVSTAWAQTESFTVGSWFFGKNVTGELPPGVVDVADNLWSSTTRTCPILITGSQAAPIAQIACRQDGPGQRFVTVIAEGDSRLAGNRLAIPVPAAAGSGRYLTSMVRPGETNLYFTSVSGSSSATFQHNVAWRLRNYTTLERVVGGGDTVTLRYETGQTEQVQVSAAGPIDGTADGREFIYLEAAAYNRYGLFEIKPGGVYERLFSGRLEMRDTPWGMGGFVLTRGGLVFRASVVVYLLDPNTRGLTQLALEGSPFLQIPGYTGVYPNLQFSQMFRAPSDPDWFYFSWGVTPGLNVPPQVVTWWKDWIWQPFYSNQPLTTNETVVGTLAAGDRVTLLGAATKGPGTSDYDLNSNITVPWAIRSLWARSNGVWTKVLRNAELPDVTPAQPKEFYQGVSARTCQADFATKQSDGSPTNSGSFYRWYRLYRPCIESATFNTLTRELVVRGVNLQDTRTEIGVPPSSVSAVPFGQLLPSNVTSISSTEVHAIVQSGPVFQKVAVLINGQVWSDPADVQVIANPAPILADVRDINFEYTPPSPGKIMIACASTFDCASGGLGCRTASTPSVNYPTTLGTCSVILDNGTALPMLYASDTQINFLMPANLAKSSHVIRITREDATGVFTSGAFPFTSSDDFPVAIKANGNVIVTVVRNGAVLVLGPNDPIHPGEYFTIYTTGGLLQNFPATAQIGSVDTLMAAAFVNWAQGVIQVNVLAPSQSVGSVQAKIGNITPFPVTVR